jgi:hypothetical protein
MPTGKSTTVSRPKSAAPAKVAPALGDDTAVAEVEPPEANAPGETPPGCTECFPAGWPSYEAEGVGCAHGSWARDKRPEAD